jgi:O-antigen biosynthesis protein WbqV
MCAVLILRYQFEPRPLPQDMVWRSSLAFGAVCALIFPAFKLERGLWRYTALNDVVDILKAVGFANLVLIPVLFLSNRLNDFPRTAIFIEAPLLAVWMTMARLVARAARRGEFTAAFRMVNRRAPSVVIVGTPEAASDYISQHHRLGGEPLRIAGVITADSEAQGRSIGGAAVLGLINDLPRTLAQVRRGSGGLRVVLADPRPSHALVQAAVAAAAEAGALVSRRRGVGSALAPVEAADLLDRPPRKLDQERARALITGKRVLITGAGGTIGSELARQVLALDPARVALVDASEYNLYAIDQSLRESKIPPLWAPELGDVRDRVRMTRLFEQYQPHVVLHAAALKHVPLMETHPAEAVLTNILGARIIAGLAQRQSEALVFISTDKAVNPTNVMGATKRVAEQVVRAICHGTGARASVVRFGNVLGSAGSVVPLFERQITEGGPLTVTHPDMVRYFMTVQEAASLVLQAAALPAACEADRDESGVYVLDMGQPVRIDDLARQMIRLHGLRPDTDIAISHTGLRPGEKLYEEIFYAAEEVRPTAADGVLSAFDVTPDWETLRPEVNKLITAAADRQEAQTIACLHELVPAFVRPSTTTPQD